MGSGIIIKPDRHEAAYRRAGGFANCPWRRPRNRHHMDRAKLGSVPKRFVSVTAPCPSSGPRLDHEIALPRLPPPVHMIPADRDLFGRTDESSSFFPRDDDVARSRRCFPRSRSGTERLDAVHPLLVISVPYILEAQAHEPAAKAFVLRNLVDCRPSAPLAEHQICRARFLSPMLLGRPELDQCGTASPAQLTSAARPRRRLQVLSRQKCKLEFENRVARGSLPRARPRSQREDLFFPFAPCVVSSSGSHDESRQQPSTMSLVD